jgi:fumarate reductase subunit D
MEGPVPMCAMDAQELKEGKFFALISYISFLCVVAMLLKKENKFVAYHAKQGLVLFVFEVVVYILSSVPLFTVLSNICLLAATVASIWGIIQVVRGSDCHIIWVSDIADKIIL